MDNKFLNQQFKNIKFFDVQYLDEAKIHAQNLKIGIDIFHHEFQCSDDSDKFLQIHKLRYFSDVCHSILINEKDIMFVDIHWLYKSHQLTKNLNIETILTMPPKITDEKKKELEIHGDKCIKAYKFLDLHLLHKNAINWDDIKSILQYFKIKI